MKNNQQSQRKSKQKEREISKDQVKYQGQSLDLVIMIHLGTNPKKKIPKKKGEQKNAENGHQKYWNLDVFAMKIPRSSRKK